MLDRIVIVGAGRTAEALLARLRGIAPTLVVENSPEALKALGTPGRVEDSTAAAGSGLPASATGTPVGEVFPITTRLADGTSRFVLEEARGDSREAVGIVAATSEDRKNIEIARLARELGYQLVIGIVVDPTTANAYEEVGARPVVRAAILGQIVERALRYEGLVVATTVGQGRGEIVEVLVLPGSPAIGVPLADLRAEGWRVAAIYRKGELVLPTGATVIEAEDRVVVVGEPSVLPGVAAQLRMGLPVFPLPYGRRVIVFLPRGRDRAIEAEAETVTIKTRATTLLRVYPDAKPDKTFIDEAPDVSDLAAHQRSKVFEDVPLEGESLQVRVNQLRRLRPGLLVARSEPRTLIDRLLGRGGMAAVLCNAVPAPVLFPRGSPRYARVVHALVHGIADLALADAAIDLARMLSLPLVVIRVALPAFFGTPDPETDRVATLIDTRSRLYGIRAETLALTGNPVDELIRAAKSSDLLVVGRRRSARDSFTSPDIALRVARAAACSVLVKTVEAP
ncbi:MAG: NAD-binding protein [Polyangiaceae bacterium]|nr:NAD-binding protein [Polyangiaceae bacterium]